MTNPYPIYSRPERIADGAVHVIGVAGAIAGTILLLGLLAPGRVDANGMMALAVYGAGMIAMLSASAAYHMAAYTRARQILRRLDHAAIYLMIAGTYTPLAVFLGTPISLGILSVVWVIAGAGAINKLFFWRRPGRWGAAPYVALGWLGVFIVWPLADTMPASSLGLIAAGGLLYTGGVAFFLWESLRFSNAIWHAFVLAATTCFFAAIVIGLPMPAS